MRKKSALSKNDLPEAYIQVLKSIGLFMQYWGFKEVHGQVWTCIFLAEEPVDANHIISHLKLSKAAVSLAIKDLVDYKVIMEVEKTKPSTRKYVSNSDLADVVLNVLRYREREMLKRVVNSVRTLKELKPEELSKANISTDRTQALQEMSEGAHLLLEQILKEDDVEVSSLLNLMQLHG